MQKEYHQWHSPSLGHDMEINVYGHYGRPMLVFPSSGGAFHEYEDFGMIEAIAPFIETGKIKVFTAGCIDGDTWLNHEGHPADRVRRHQDYDRYIVDEVIPFINDHCQGTQTIIATGCSLGAFHAANFFFRHPDVFDIVIALSGVYSVKQLIGDYMDENAYLNSPLDYLPDLNDEWFLEKLRASQIFFCVGQGAWEDQMRVDTDRMRSVLEYKKIPASIEFWGFDVEHHWYWWKKQISYYLGKIV